MARRLDPLHQTSRFAYFFTDERQRVLPSWRYVKCGEGGESKSEGSAGGASSSAPANSSQSSSASSGGGSDSTSSQTAPTGAAPAPPPAPTAEEQLVNEGFELEAVQKALQDCNGNISMARVVLKFSAARE